MANLLLLGSQSSIVQETALSYAHTNSRIYLVGRNPEQLTTFSHELLNAGAQETSIGLFDLRQQNYQHEIIDTSWEMFGHFDLAIIDTGLPFSKPNQTTSLQCVNQTINSALSHLCTHFNQQKYGHIILIDTLNMAQYTSDELQENLCLKNLCHEQQDNLSKDIFIHYLNPNEPKSLSELIQFDLHTSEQRTNKYPSQLAQGMISSLTAAVN